MMSEIETIGKVFDTIGEVLFGWQVYICNRIFLHYEIFVFTWYSS